MENWALLHYPHWNRPSPLAWMRMWMWRSAADIPVITAVRNPRLQLTVITTIAGSLVKSQADLAMHGPHFLLQQMPLLKSILYSGSFY